MWRSLLFALALVPGIRTVAQVHHRVNVRDTLYTIPQEATWTLRDSLPDGVWSLYEANVGGFFRRIIHPRVLVLRGSYVARRRHGTFTYYDPNHRGQVSRTESYRNGSIDGEYQLFLNGVLQTRGAYRNGMKEGLWQSYDECWRRNEAGQAISLLGYYLASETEYANGQVISSRTYTCDQAHTR